MSEIPWRARYPLLTDAWLAAEQGLMRAAYPQFRLTWRDGMLSFCGPMRSNYGSEFQIEVRLLERYPEQEPHLWVLSPALPAGTEHRYTDGRICAHASPFVAYRTTVASMVSVMAGWLFRFDRKRLHGVGWDEPILPDGQALSVNPDGSLYLP